MSTVVKIFGGLGNQLFQYSFGETIRHLSGHDVKYDNSSFTKELSGESRIERNFSLPQLGINIPIASRKEIFEAKSQLSSIKEFLSTKLQIALQNECYINGPAPKILAKSLSSDKSIYIQGYFQSEVYAQIRREIIISDIDYNAKILHPIKSHLTISQSSFNLQDSVAVHIRLGDYLHASNKSKLFICDSDWYIKCIKFMQDQGHNNFVVFTDDVEKAKSFTSQIKANIIYANDVIDPCWEKQQACDSSILEFLLLMQFKYYIIPNSTFSWWAQFLSTSKKFTLGPDKWSRSGKLQDSLLNQLSFTIPIK